MFKFDVETSTNCTQTTSVGASRQAGRQASRHGDRFCLTKFYMVVRFLHIFAVENFCKLSLKSNFPVENGQVLVRQNKLGWLCATNSDLHISSLALSTSKVVARYVWSKKKNLVQKTGDNWRQMASGEWGVARGKMRTTND